MNLGILYTQLYRLIPRNTEIHLRGSLQEIWLLPKGQGQKPLVTQKGHWVMLHYLQTTDGHESIGNTRVGKRYLWLFS